MPYFQLAGDERLSVLLVDDNPDDRLIISEYVLVFAFPVELKLASTLEEGAEMARKDPIDVALVDLNLTKTRGLDTLDAARRLIPNTALVLLTGDARGAAAIDCLRKGAQDFLLKGHFDEMDLEKSIRFSLERHRQALSFREKSEQLDMILETQPGGLLVLDHEGRVMRCNKAASEILGHSEADLIGRTSPVPVATALSREFEYNGRTIQASASQTDWEGRGLGLVTLLDVSQRREMERRAAQNEKLETVARVCFGVAHEFNNLLAMTRTKTDFIESLCREDPVWEAHIADIKQACDRGSHLVKRLMTFYGKKRVNEEAIDLAEFLQAGVPHFESLCLPEHTILLSKLQEGALCGVPETSLTRIFSNLVRNARDAMPQGGKIRIEMELEDRPAMETGLSEGEKLICVTVADEGEGIPEANQSRIFDPFFTTKDTRAGRGLGLSIVSNLLRESSGWIEFESEFGQGSVFRVFLPTLSSADEKPLLPVRSLKKDRRTRPSDGEGSSILVVDDESIIRFSVTRLLEADGFTVHCAESGEAALELLEDPEVRIDLLLTDLNMPGMGGKALATQALYMREKLRLVIMSGFGSSGVDDGWMKERSAKFIAKPFTRASLIQCIDGVLSNGVATVST